MRWLSWFGRRRKREEELDREIRTHIELETEVQLEAGIPADRARETAQRAFGSSAYVKEDVRRQWSWTAVEQVLQDARFALRGIRRNPGLSAAAIASLALGIGATTSMFGVLNAVVLRPLPVEQPDELVVIRPTLRGKRFVLFHPLFESLRDRQTSLAGMFAVSDDPYLKASVNGAAPAFHRASLVSGNYFDVLGLRPALGRLLQAGDDQPSGACAVVASHRYWQSQLRGSPDAIGLPVTVRDAACTIVGVAPEGFGSHEPGYAPEFWIPMRRVTDPKLLASRSMAFYSGVMGRLRDGSGRRAAEAEMTALYQSLQPAEQPSPHPGEPATHQGDYRISVESGAQGLDSVRRVFGEPILLAFLLTGVVLLIAAVNVANLLLARGAARTVEFATREALGAGRSRLVRLLMVEGTILAIGGGLAGFCASLLVAPALAGTMMPPNRPFVFDASSDARVVAAAAMATLVAALCAGLVPALRLRSPGLQTGMVGAGRTIGTRSGQRLIRSLVTAQFAMSLVMLSAVGLLVRTMGRVMEVDPGFNPSGVILMDIRDTVPSARFGETDSPDEKTRRAARYQELDERFNAIPGVEAAGVSWLGLFGGNYVGLNVYDIEAPDKAKFTLVDYVSPRYFEAVGMALRRGRGIGEGDREGSPRVAVVNEAFARERFGGREALGRQLVMTYADDRRPFTVAGVVRDAKYNDPREKATEPMMWVPLAQAPHKITSVSLRVRPGSDGQVIQAAKAALAAVSPSLMVRRETTLRAQVDQATMRERLLLKLASGFGGLAVVLAAVGLYGTLAFAVVRRRRDIGLRLALGAQRGMIVRMMVREALMVVGFALAAGIPLALGVARLMRAFLFGVGPADLVAFGGAVSVLTGVALVAAVGPAVRASRIDPMAALKWE